MEENLKGIGYPWQFASLVSRLGTKQRSSKSLLVVFGFVITKHGAVSMCFSNSTKSHISSLQVFGENDKHP